MTLVDSNIPMYLIGTDHPNKDESRRLLERLIAEGERLVTDAEVLREILHRYGALRRRDAIQPAFDALLGVVDEVYPITASDARRAKDILLGSDRVSARDAIHLAVMERCKVRSVLTFDRGFDGFPGVRRIGS